MSLNLHLEELGLVLRVHPRFESVDRLHALRALRRTLQAAGVAVGVPQPLFGREIVEIDGRFAEAETYLTARTPDATWDAYVWMYESMGRLHRAINASSRSMRLPSPRVATYASPGKLRRWIDTTSSAVAGDEHAKAIAAQAAEMVDDLARQWTRPELLPIQIVHGDIRLGNVAMTPSGDTAYFDFGFAATRPRIHEVAYSLFWIVLKPDDTGRPADFDWSRVAELIEAYETAAGQPVEPIERRALGPYLAAVPLYLAAIASYTPEPSERIKQETASLTIARWVLDHPEQLLH